MDISGTTAPLLAAGPLIAAAVWLPAMAHAAEKPTDTPTGKTSMQQNIDTAHEWLVVDRMISGKDGETHFVRTRFPRQPDERADRNTPWLPRSIQMSSSEISLRYLPDGFDIHAMVPERRLVVMMSGRVEVTVSDGEKRSWGPGEAFLATDEGAGKGHRTRTVGGPATMLIVPLGKNIDFDAWDVKDTPAR